MLLLKDKVEWNKLLDEEFNDFNDIYYRYEYFELYKDEYNVDAEGVYWEDGNVKIFWPHLIRKISEIDFFKDFEYYDLTTPYGYGGPLIMSKANDRYKTNNSLKEFFYEYEKYALKNGYVCEFVRFHPLFKNWELLNGFLEVEYTNDIVVVDLERDKERIWKDIKKGHRYNIKKSLERGIDIQIMRDPDETDIENFVSIYHQTMDRSKASAKYFFTRKFISEHFGLLSAILVNAKHKNQIIGTGIFLPSQYIVHYHLSGSKVMKGLYPTGSILWSMMIWAKDNNYRLLNLGGGRGKNDSLFEFKRGFSGRIFPFNIGKKIFDMEVYGKLATMNPRSSSDYFPAYRRTLDERIV